MALPQPGVLPAVPHGLMAGPVLALRQYVRDHYNHRMYSRDLLHTAWRERQFMPGQGPMKGVLRGRGREVSTNPLIYKGAYWKNKHQN